jgi:6-phosphogluconolactonase
MKKFTTVVAILTIATLFAGCKKEDENEQGAHHVYTMSNQAAGNSVIAFERRSDGSLQLEDSVATGGTGTGSGLGSQDALSLSRNQNWLLAVNAGSNEIFVLRIKGHQLQLTSKVSSGGTKPVSITSYQNWVYVLNAGNSPNLAGFYLSASGTLTPIANSIRQLSDKVTDAAQISFSEDGASLVISEKAANKIVSYNVTNSGTPGESHELSSASPTPFGFAVGKQGDVFVSEAMQSALSVYRVTDTAISLISGPVLNHQKAACWVVLTKNGQYAYTANASSNTISGYRVSSSNQITLLNADGVTATTGNAPIDEALSSNSQYLYVLNSGSHTIRAFTINSDGSLQFVADAEGLPIGAGGLVAD